MTTNNRKGEFVGAYIPQELKERMKREGVKNFRNVSQELEMIITKHYERQDAETNRVKAESYRGPG